MKRIVRFFFAWFGWETGSRRGSAHEVPAAVREEHRRRIDGFNRALAAAAALRSLLQAQLNELRAKETRARTQLEKAVAAGNEHEGARLALEIQSLSAELTEAAERLDGATRNTTELNELRDEAITRARSELHDVSDLVRRISGSGF